LRVTEHATTVTALISGWSETNTGHRDGITHSGSDSGSHHSAHAAFSERAIPT
jgi:hypothetical protein